MGWWVTVIQLATCSFGPLRLPRLIRPRSACLPARLPCPFPALGSLFPAHALASHPCFAPGSLFRQQTDHMLEIGPTKRLIPRAKLPSIGCKFRGTTQAHSQHRVVPSSFCPFVASRDSRQKSCARGKKLRAGHANRLHRFKVMTYPMLGSDSEGESSGLFDPLNDFLLTNRTLAIEKKIFISSELVRVKPLDGGQTHTESSQVVEA